MTEPLTGFASFQARRLEEIHSDFSDLFKKAETQKELRDLTAQYHLARAAIGVGPDDMGSHGLVVPPAANANPRPASLPPSRKCRRAGTLLAAAGGFFVLSWVYLLIAITSLVTYYPRRAYYRITGK